MSPVGAGQPIQVAHCASAVGQHSASMRWDLSDGAYTSRKDSGWAIAASGTSNNARIVLQPAAGQSGQSGQRWTPGPSRTADPWKFLTVDIY
ncbi:hypothetical protein ACFHYQ_14750 [Sphaerimonospora cavernae]|uniref:Ricin B lectin domain-containing protein n=1 Tax=Sphaerimonospora cavernae TaxID=1740611 RepID=A0ABV6U537_9ACTN